MTTLTSDDVIVLAIHRGQTSWYVSERDPWVLDHQAWTKMFLDAGYEVPGAPETHRFGIPVVDVHTAEAFLRHMQAFRVPISTLPTLRNPYDEPALPHLVVDFDQREQVIGDVDSPLFEKFLPPGWTARFNGILETVPEALRYWL